MIEMNLQEMIQKYNDDTITLDENGKGSFYCDGGSVSVWVKQGNLYS